MNQQHTVIVTKTVNIRNELDPQTLEFKEYVLRRWESELETAPKDLGLGEALIRSFIEGCNIVAASLPGGSRALGFSARLLPSRDADRYAEEWRGYLYDMREDRERWYRRALFVIDVLLRTAPKLAVTLRLGRSKVIE